MFELKVENARGDIITLTHDESNYQVFDIEGLNPPNAAIYQSEVAGMDGTAFKSSKLEPRNLVIYVKINGKVEENRQRLYRYFRTKQYCKVYFKNRNRNVYAEGYVEVAECSLYTSSQVMQVSIVCPDPYFKSYYAILTDISHVIGNFEFPFAFGAEGVEADTITDEAIEFSTYVKDRVSNIFNEGEETGFTIAITATGRVVNPHIFDAVTREEFAVKITMEKNDTLIINSTKGSKSVQFTRDNVTRNWINNIVKGSAWLTLKPGDNQFAYDCAEGAEYMNIIFSHRTKYQAV